MMPPSFRSAFFFAARTAVAATIALCAAMSLGLDEPHWSAWTVVSVGLPLRTDALVKSLYRMLGTLVGAPAAFVLAVLGQGHPALLMALLSLWLAAWVRLALLLDPPRGYGAVLAGYGAVIVAMASAGASHGLTELAAWSATRCTAIALGLAISGLLIALELLAPGWPRIGLPALLHPLPPATPWRRRVALVGALRAGACLQLAGWVWMLTDWKGGGLLISFTAINVALFSIRPDPAAATRRFLAAGGAGVASAVLLRQVAPLLGEQEWALPLALGLLAFTALLAAALLADGFLSSCYCLALFVLTDPRVFFGESSDSLKARGAGILAGAGLALIGYRFRVRAPSSLP